MILEAFSVRLRSETEALMAARLKPDAFAEAGLQPPPKARDVLERWLTEFLRKPLPVVAPGQDAAQRDAAWQIRHITSIIHTEVARLVVDGTVHFQGRSPSGQRLVDTLYEYCDSYDHWLFSRWLHQLQASDFESAPKPPQTGGL